MPRRKNDEYRPIKEETEIELQEIIRKQKIEESNKIKSVVEEPKKRGRKPKEENKNKDSKEENKENKEKKVEKSKWKRFKEETKKKEEKLKKEKKDSKENKKESKNKKVEEEQSLVEQSEIALDKAKLDKIEEEIKRQTELPEERKNKINKRIFPNILIAIGIVIYFIFVISGYQWLDKLTYLRVQQVYSIVTIVITIIIFEIAYKKDSDYITCYGIEFLILSICSLITINIALNFPEKYVPIINSISMLFSIYYIGKTIYFYRKMRKKALRKVSDINKVGRM